MLSERDITLNELAAVLGTKTIVKVFEPNNYKDIFITECDNFSPDWYSVFLDKYGNYKVVYIGVTNYKELEVNVVKPFEGVI